MSPLRSSLSHPLRLALAAVVLAAGTGSAEAQSFRPTRGSRSALPSNSQLAAVGLERAWWGQAPVSYGRDRIKRIFTDEDNVYTISRQGLVTAFDAETGQRLFSTLLGNDSTEAEAPTTNATTFLIPIGMTLVALDKFSGNELWKLNLDGQPSCGPGADDDRVFVGTVNGKVYAYDLRRIRKLFNDGRLPEFSHLARDWQFQAFGSVTAPPVSTGRDLNFATRSGVMYGVTTGDRALLYQFMTDGQIIAPVTRAGDRVLIPSTDLNLYCIDNRTGQLQWTYLTATNVLQAPSLIGDDVFVVPQRRGLHSIDVNTGKLSWRQPAADDLLAATPGQLFANGSSGRLLTLDRKNGVIKDQIDLPRFTVRTGNERTDRLYLATENGLLVCLREIGRDFPLFYRYPDQQPISPVLGADEPIDTSETSERGDGEPTEDDGNPFTEER